MNKNEEYRVFELLQKVIQQKAYSGIELDKSIKNLYNENINTGYVTKLFYGVLEKNVQFDYIINKLCDKPPKQAVQIIIKIGLYLLRYTDVPSYAAINKIVQLTKDIGKSGVSGFVNAVLKNSVTIELPVIKNAFSLSVNSSYPLWLTEMIIEEYGFDFAKELLLYKQTNETHIRFNGFKFSDNKVFEEKYPFLTGKSSSLGYYVTHNDLKQLEDKDYAAQSLSSMIAVKCYFEKNPEKILDLCAAPGGKSIFLLEQHFLNSGKLPFFTACDIHPHRVELIKKYAEKFKCEINIMQNDATILRDDFIDGFEQVICDVPCSGIGVISSKPDILLNKSPEDICKLSEIQRKIISMASKYVKINGTLCYSTCTVLKQENEDIISEFLNSHPDFSVQKIETEYAKTTVGGFVKLLPNADNCDGFFVAKLKRNY